MNGEQGIGKAGRREAGRGAKGKLGLVALVAVLAMALLGGSARASTISIGSVLPVEFTPTKFEQVKTMFNTAVPERGANLTSPVSGAIVRWKVQGAKGGPFYLRVLHPNGGGGYSSVGTSGGVTPSGPGLQEFTASIPIKAGDQIGIDPTNPSDEIGIAAVPNASFGFIFPPPPDGATVAPNGAGSGEIELSAEVQPTPKVTGLAPNFDAIAGGAEVTITGTDFKGASAVKFGDLPAASYRVDSDTQITAVAPRVPAPTLVEISVTTVAGTSNLDLRTDGFAYRACVVPKLKGKTLQAAKNRLQGARCKPGVVKKLAGATAKTGKVVSQGPKPGKILPPDSKVNFKLGVEEKKAEKAEK